MEKRYKCPYCDYRGTKIDLIEHVQDEHEEMIPKGFTAARVVFNYIYHKTHGTCVVCKRETEWDEDKCKYKRLCGRKVCNEALRNAYKKNMLHVYGKTTLLNDPEQQEKMLKNRGISGKYKFSDGGVHIYTGSYEKKTMEFLDKVLHYKSTDILAPGPTFDYEFKGKKLKWITDILIIPYNLVIEVKDGGDNPNNRSMPEYRAKQIAKEKMITNMGKYNYLRLTNNNFEQLIDILAEMKAEMIDDSADNKKVIINIHEETNAIMEQSIGLSEGVMNNHNFATICRTRNCIYRPAIEMSESERKSHFSKTNWVYPRSKSEIREASNKFKRGEETEIGRLKSFGYVKGAGDSHKIMAYVCKCINNYQKGYAKARLFKKDGFDVLTVIKTAKNKSIKESADDVVLENKDYDKYRKSFKSFDDFCKVMHTPYDVLNWMKINHATWPKSFDANDRKNMRFYWPDDIIRDKIGTCFDFALFMHYFCQRKNIPCWIARVSRFIRAYGKKEYSMSQHFINIVEIDKLYYTYSYAEWMTYGFDGPYESKDNAFKAYNEKSKPMIDKTVKTIFGIVKKSDKYDIKVFNAIQDPKEYAVYDKFYGDTKIDRDDFMFKYKYCPSIICKYDTDNKELHCDMLEMLFEKISKLPKIAKHDIIAKLTKSKMVTESDEELDSSLFIENCSSSYQDALSVYDTLSDKDKHYCSPNGKYVNTPICVWRHVLYEGERPVAFIDLNRLNGTSKNIAFIIYAVEDKYRRQGLSRILLRKAFKAADENGFTKIQYYVFKDNIPSIHAAEAYGFKKVRDMKDHFVYELPVIKGLQESTSIDDSYIDKAMELISSTDEYKNFMKGKSDKEVKHYREKFEDMMLKNVKKANRANIIFRAVSVTLGVLMIPVAIELGITLLCISLLIRTSNTLDAIGSREKNFLEKIYNKEAKKEPIKEASTDNGSFPSMDKLIEEVMRSLHRNAIYKKYTNGKSDSEIAAFDKRCLTILHNKISYIKKDWMKNHYAEKAIVSACVVAILVAVGLPSIGASAIGAYAANITISSIYKENMALAGINPVVGANNNVGYVTQYGMNSTFDSGFAYSNDMLSKRVITKDKITGKLALKDSDKLFENAELKIFKCNMSDLSKIMILGSIDEEVDDDFIYSAITGKKMLSEDQIYIDPLFTEIDPVLETAKTSSAIQTLLAEYANIDKKILDIGIPLMDDKSIREANEKIGDRDYITIFESVNGYFAENANNRRRTATCKSISDLRLEVL